MLKNGDFILIEYTGYDKNGLVFDSTHGEVSKELRKREGPLLVVFGRGQLIQGLEESIKNAQINKEFEVSVPPEKGFGLRKKDLFHIIKEEDMKKHNVLPKPGLNIHLDIDGRTVLGVIKSVTSGRVLVDFNHPLAGQTLRYKINIVEKITDPEKKAEYVLKELGVKSDNTSLNSGKLKLKISNEKNAKDFGKIKKIVEGSIKSSIPEIKEVSFE
ncbi:MAG: peptidylprolyl isomerase [Candidatus ainarchaeum sp.]|nr:peptidylprolyl isomerase [Candidatus ainarchaeum sp.]